MVLLCALGSAKASSETASSSVIATPMGAQVRPHSYGVVRQSMAGASKIPIKCPEASVT